MMLGYCDFTTTLTLSVGPSALQASRASLVWKVNECPVFLPVRLLDFFCYASVASAPPALDCTGRGFSDGAAWRSKRYAYTPVQLLLYRRGIEKLKF